MENRRAQELLDRYQNNLCTEHERAIVESWFLDLAKNKEDNLPEPAYELLKQDYWNRIQAQQLKDKKSIKLWPSIGVAAAVIGLAVCIYFFTAPSHPKPGSGSPSYANDIGPGKNTATLIINKQGKVIQLSDAKTGVIFNKDKVTYNDGTAIGGRDPEFSSGTQTDKAVPLSLLTPLGGTYSTILPDGTKVWLNADSKLEFLSNFRNVAQRIVKLTGEAYFEVAKDKAHPFIVQSAGQNVTVLGTHFNISAYKGEGIRTTLLEGSVKVNAVSLKPNQQSLLTGNTIKVSQANIEETMAWKNGNFIFNGESIQNIMLKLQRWYDIEVNYQGDVSTELYYGNISRFKNISEVLKMLEKAQGVHFKVEGRRVTVTQ
ncbi:hypothetical protein HDC92_003085 [Pedobacter sp. AK017]|uniref:FecR family protein n=1 Tax=Pedobacter sp. AK017 TaxID=2723073 RepID=UPI0016097B01|nr:FecR family protein [Pedobacter sp. AK017]MBB5439392.1 hypothetical protein [Pedobacter sp. AK017]